YGTRTSPVRRGKWILETFFGTPVPPSPSSPPLPDDDPRTPVRPQLDIHARNPMCASCHATMDALGYTLEQFDAVGHWRTAEGGEPINTAVTLADGTAMNGAADLRTLLSGRGTVFVTTVVDRLMTYALGRRIAYYDMPSIRAIVKETESADYRWSAVIA